MAKQTAQTEAAPAEKKELPEALRKKYALPDGSVAVFACELGEIDISKINAQQAEQLAKLGHLKELGSDGAGLG